VLYTSCFFTLVAMVSVRRMMCRLTLASLLVTLIIGALRAADLASRALVGMAMVLDVLASCVLIIVLAWLAVMPENASKVWKNAAKAMRQKEKRGDLSVERVEDMMIQKFQQACLSCCMRSPQKCPTTSRGQAFCRSASHRGETYDSVIRSYHKQCHAVAIDLLNRGMIKPEEIEDQSYSFVVGLPGVVLFRCLLRSAEPNVTGIMLADETQVNPDFGSFAERSILQIFLSLRDEVRATNLLQDRDLVRDFEVKLLNNSEDKLTFFDDAKAKVVSCWASFCSSAPSVNTLFSKMNGITLDITKMSVFKEQFAIFQKDFSREPYEQPLFSAAQNGDLSRLQELLELHKHTCDLNTLRSPKRATLLITAAMWGHFDVVGSLCERKAEVNAHTSSGKTALWCAAYYGQREVVELLLKKRADPHIQDSERSTAVKAAAFQGHTEVVDILCKHGAILNSVPRRMQPGDALAINSSPPSQDEAEEPPLESEVIFIMNDD